MRFRRRVQKILRERRMGATGYRLQDGSVRWLRDKDVPTAFYEAIDGIDTPRARVMMSAVDCVSLDGSRLHELAQAIRPNPYKSPEKETLQ